MNKIKVLLFLIFVVIVSVSNGQTIKTHAKDSIPKGLLVEEVPIYPGGEKAFMKFINKRLSYPVGDTACHIPFLRLHFTIDPSGQAINPKVVAYGAEKCIYLEDYRKKVEDAFLLMPKWKPGICKEKGNYIDYSIPIVIGEK